MHARDHETFIIFDSYRPDSMKSHGRERRAGGAKLQKYSLNPETVLPNKDIVMKSDQNKTEVIKIICKYEHTYRNLHMIGIEQSKFSHEEADVTIIGYLLKYRQGRKHIQVTADYMDIFVLLTSCVI